VGTLWPVRSDIAELFFGVFYEQLRDGASRLDAFARAQRAARDWSQYRLWGAFFMAGAWD
jgi:CHAT domain-containing protein